MTAAVTFAASFAALYVGHSVGDHWVQSHNQARNKGAPTWAGRIACTTHVMTLTGTKLLALGLVMLVTGLRPDGPWMLAGLLVDAVSHYWADRAARWKDRPAETLVTLERLADRLGKADFYRLGAGHLGSGAHALDQSWHVAWLFIAALIIAGGGS